MILIDIEENGPVVVCGEVQTHMMGPLHFQLGRGVRREEPNMGLTKLPNWANAKMRAYRTAIRVPENWILALILYCKLTLNHIRGCWTEQNCYICDFWHEKLQIL